MPKIQWSDLPVALRDHLFERLRERRISAEDLYQLKLWRESDPDAPDGAWIKILVRSKFAGKANSRRPSFSAASPQKAKDSKPLFSCSVSPRRQSAEANANAILSDSLFEETYHSRLERCPQ
jgi:hypothetical protein